MENEKVIAKPQSESISKLTQDELDALTKVKIPFGRKVSKTWKAMVKYKGQSVVNDPSLLV